MLSDIDKVFESFFIPSYNNFVSLFPNKRDICSLMYSLDFYHNKINMINEDTGDMEISRIDRAVKDTIDSLIDIELSFNKSVVEEKRYADKFMSLITDDDIDMMVSDVCCDYKGYAYNEIKKRVLRRVR